MTAAVIGNTSAANPSHKYVSGTMHNLCLLQDYGTREFNYAQFNNW